MQQTMRTDNARALKQQQQQQLPTTRAVPQLATRVMHVVANI